jgi:hypothetical protein
MSKSNNFTISFNAFADSSISNSSRNRRSRISRKSSKRGRKSARIRSSSR